MLQKQIFSPWEQGHVSQSSQKHFCFTYANYAFEMYVSQFSHSRNMTGSNVSATMFPSLARPLFIYQRREKTKNRKAIASPESQTAKPRNRQNEKGTR